MFRVSLALAVLVAVFVSCGILQGGPPTALAAQLPGAEPLDPLARKLLPAEDLFQKFQEGRKKGLIEIAPVNLPVNPPGDCNHYGWPVATMVDDTIVVMHRRIPGHQGLERSGKPNKKMSYGIVLRSQDGGRTWSEPYDLRMSMAREDRYRGGIVPLSHRGKFAPDNKSKKGYKIHLHAIGTTRDNAVVAINNHGVFRSEDKGKNWKHFSRALREDTLPGELVNLGPRIIDHPARGLLAFGNRFGTARNLSRRKKLVVLESRDGGATWEASDYEVGFSQYEPAALLHRGRFLFVTRNQDTGYTYGQMIWTPGRQPEVTDTNLEHPHATNMDSIVDTVDLSYNPVTKRLELCRSERATTELTMALSLWSMDPADWEKGHWKRECRLLDRRGYLFHGGDGFHPAGAVIDTERGVQHIFIYSGYTPGPAGIFRITRTLETDRLAAFLK